MTGAVLNINLPNCILIHGVPEIQNQETQFGSCNVLRTNLRRKILKIKTNNCKVCYR